MATEYRTALITGASSGLGHGLALWFARRGVKVYAAARRSENLEALRKEAANLGAEIVPVTLDVSRPDAVVKKVRELDEDARGLDLVVANAGVGDSTNARRLQWTNVQRIIDVNVSGAAATLCAALPGMVERNKGHLVGVSSLAAYRGLPRSAAYCASKAFLSVFLEGLRIDLRGTGVKITTLHPGFVKTELTANSKNPMPFILETDRAVEKMGKAIVRGDAEFAFPWQLAGAMKGVKLLPNALFDFAAGGGPKRKKVARAEVGAKD